MWKSVLTYTRSPEWNIYGKALSHLPLLLNCPRWAFSKQNTFCGREPTAELSKQPLYRSILEESRSMNTKEQASVSVWVCHFSPLERCWHYFTWTQRKYCNCDRFPIQKMNKVLPYGFKPLWMRKCRDERRDWLKEKEKKVRDSKGISERREENNAIGVCMGGGAMQPNTKIILATQWLLLKIEFV